MRIASLLVVFVIACGGSGSQQPPDAGPEPTIDAAIDAALDASIDAPQCSDAAQCDDGDPCNGAETCTLGNCAAGTPLVCDDANACTNDACVANVGCTTTAIPPCDDGNGCTLDACDPAIGCVATPRTGESCADADLCDGQEFCDSAGACVAGVAVDCNDDNSCTSETCDPAIGCVVTINEGAACADGDVCNGLET